MKERGSFKAYIPDKEKGIKLADIFGERMEIRPKTFQVPLLLGIHRTMQGFRAVHYRTGHMLGQGKTVADAVSAAEKMLTDITEPEFNERLTHLTIINHG